MIPDIEHKSKQSPASNAYKPDLNASSLNKRIPKANLNRDRSPKAPLAPVKKSDLGPASYKDADRTWGKLSQHVTKNFAYSISKEPKKSFIDFEVKKKKAVPAAGAYKYDMGNFDKLSRGTSVPHFKRGR